MTIFRFVVLAILVVAAALLPGCVEQRLPQEQSQRADRIGPLQIHIHADYNVLTARDALEPDAASERGADGARSVVASGASGAPGASTQPAEKSGAKSAKDDGIATITHNTTTMTVHVSTQGSSTQAATATGGSPGPVSNTPSVSVPVSVTPVP